MILTFLFSFFSRPVRFVWSPSLDLSDNHILSTLLPHAHS